MKSTTNDLSLYGIDADYWLETSLNIEIPNINLNNIHDNHPLSDEQIEMLQEHDVKNEKISQMTLTDFNDWEKTITMSEKSIQQAKYIYPALIDVDMTKWTYGQWQEYYINADSINKNIYGLAPSESEEQELLNRNITLNDASRLARDFGSYKELLSLDNTYIKELITNFYLAKIKYAQTYGNLQINIADTKSIATMEISNSKISIDSLKGRSNVQVIATTDPPPPSGMDVTKYTWVESFPCYHNLGAYGDPGYDGDFFHNSTYTWWTESFRTAQSYYANALFRYTYHDMSATPYFTNLWGTYSISQDGAHEGIDMIHGDGEAIYAATGYGITTTPQTDRVILQSYGASYPYAVYMHMTDRQATNIYSWHEQIGEEGNVGNSTGHHLHFEVNSSPQSGSDDTLSSSSPYSFTESNGIPISW